MSRRENWIKHDLNSRNDLKMMAFLERVGCVGYGAFWIIVEQLNLEREHRLATSSKGKQRLAMLCKIPEEQLNKILSVAIEEELFHCDDNFFWSPKVIREATEETQKNQELSAKRAAAGSLGGKQTQANASKTYREREEIDQRERKKEDPVLPPSEIEKQNPPEVRQHSVQLPKNFDTPKVRDALTRWAKHRRKLDLHFDEMALEALILNWAHDPGGFVKSVNVSISNGWKTVQPQAASAPSHATGALTTPAEASLVLKRLHNQGVPIPGIKEAK